MHIDKRLGYLQPLGDRFERRVFVAALIEQLDRSFDRSLALQRGNFVAYGQLSGQFAQARSDAGMTGMLRRVACRRVSRPVADLSSEQRAKITHFPTIWRAVIASRASRPRS